MTGILRVKQDTIFKQSTMDDGQQLAKEFKTAAKKGQLFSVKTINYAGGNNHWKVQFELPIDGKENWFVYEEHVEHWEFGKKLK